MTRLVDALANLGRQAEISPSGRWVRFQGIHCAVVVAEASRGRVFLSWCDHPAERTVERYEDPVDAIAAGLRRSARLSRAETGNGPAS
jgi:hypothetical protein